MNIGGMKLKASEMENKIVRLAGVPIVEFTHGRFDGYFFAVFTSEDYTVSYAIADSPEKFVHEKGIKYLQDEIELLVYADDVDDLAGEDSILWLTD